MNADQIKQAWRAERAHYKENKRAMKESWKEMKRAAVTEADKQALKEVSLTKHGKPYT